MQKERTYLQKAERVEKLPAGPNAPRPGPILLTQVSAAVKLSLKLNPSRETTTAPAIIIRK